MFESWQAANQQWEEPLERGKAVGIGPVRELEARKILHLRDHPRLGAVAEVAVGKDENRRHVLHREAARLDREVTRLRAALAEQAPAGRPREETLHGQKAIERQAALVAPDLLPSRPGPLSS